MAKIGLSKPYYALYNVAEGAVSYSDGGLLGKFTELSIELAGGDPNILRADDAAAESDKTFAGGTASVTTDDLLAPVMLPVLGLKSEVITNSVTTGAAWMVFDDDQEIPYVGLGGVIKKKVNGKIRYVGFVLDKVQFANPGISAVTQGETIQWQTHTLAADIMQSDKEKHPWFRMTSELDTAAEAEAAVKAYLSIT